MSVVVAALYKFVAIEDYHELREPLLDQCVAVGAKGSLLLAREGINGTIAGERAAVDSVLAWLRRDARFADLAHKESLSAHMPFRRMKVKLKREIVTLGVPGVDPTAQVGRYVPPAEWNALISDPDVLVVDTRNAYEVRIGTFEGAIDPGTDSFREFPAYASRLDPGRHRKVAMFCTGGIRCEKASAYLLQSGFAEVYHLQGGILKYLEEVPAEQSLWRGECYVFDDRVAVGHGLEPGSHTLCYGCGEAVSPAERASPCYELGVSCPRCSASLTDAQRAAFRERRRQLELRCQRGEEGPAELRPAERSGD